MSENITFPLTVMLKCSSPVTHLHSNTTTLVTIEMYFLTTPYNSVDQSAKDIVNGILLNETILKHRRHGRIITLDDVTNGTVSTFIKGGYEGTLVAVQRDREVLTRQQQNFRKTFGKDRRWVPHIGDIYRNFAASCELWVDAEDMDLWNFDFMGTFQGETALMLRRFLENPSACMRSDEAGTLVAFTFQAVANGNLMVKLKNVTGWDKILEDQRRLKSHGTQYIAEHYHDAISSILNQHRPSCVTFEPVLLDGVNGFNVHRNSLVYGGARPNDSIMMLPRAPSPRLY